MQIESITPVLSVSDLPAALEFYVQTLGFSVAWSWGEPPHIAAVCKDRVEINLSQMSDAKPAGGSHVYLRITESIDEWYAALLASGARLLVPIGDRPYGLRDFRIADPSGNELSIGQVL